MRLVFASNNAHKLEEVRKILAPRTVLSLHDVGFESDIEETGNTLEENSRIKACTVADWLAEHHAMADTLVFADDTGLEIEALNGQPGVHTARWAGEPACDAANRRKAIAELEGKNNRNARFRTVITLVWEGKVEQVCGEVKGQMESEEHGDYGFGYDPIFTPEGYDKTFAELPAEVKNSISHRARALEKLAEKLLFLQKK